MDTSHEEPRNLAEELELPEQLDDDEGAAPAGGPLRFARMTGSSIAGRDAAAWVTDFLNGAYYRRPVAEREVDDLRLAFSILTTYWYRKGRGRLRITDLPAFHRAYGAHRFDTQDGGRGLMSRDQLLEGATDLIGDWFPDAYHDDARRGWGIAFPTAEETASYDPERRFKLAKQATDGVRSHCSPTWPAESSSGLRWLVRYALVAGPILMPLGFFLSIASPRAQNPNRLIYLVPLGGVSLSVGAVTLGLGLLSA